ncbi:hypothetical protein KFU94_50750 [Chloroflexi bacterium TSY]|nr:hypothetical protein [Chloroflexi bacterium TSY]
MAPHSPCSTRKSASGPTRHHDSGCGGDLHATGNINTDGLIRVRNKPPVLILRMRDLANDNDANTRISADDYDCVATSWLGEWDINEDSNGVSGVWRHVVGNTWFIRAEMNSDNPHERLDVDMLCFLRALTEYPLDRRTMNTPND